MLAIVVIAVSAVLALVLCVLLIMKPKRLKLHAGLWRVLTFNLEVDDGSDARRHVEPGSTEHDYLLP